MSSSLENTLTHTDYKFKGQTNLYHGKVRDVYTLDGRYLAIVATDRISAFDVVLPKAIPYKGQVLNQLAAYFLENTKEVVPNWLISMPDPNVSIGYKCQPIKVEVVVRMILVGHAWREYRSGKRLLSGVPLTDGMREYDRFSEPIITPSTKAEAGHDEDISAEEIVSSGLSDKKQWDEICKLSLQLFNEGQRMAESRGLILADTKYEFGLLDGKLVVMDEIHTPDSSRYFYLNSYNEYLVDRSRPAPKHLSKEFVRNWLVDNGFSGHKGETVPEMTDEIIEAISERYIELYEQLTDKKFIKGGNTAMAERIETNINKEMGRLR